VPIGVPAYRDASEIDLAGSLALPFAVQRAAFTADDSASGLPA
jgi:hypothetical protein